MHIPHAADRHEICACIHKTQQYLDQALVPLTYSFKRPVVSHTHPLSQRPWPQRAVG